MSNNAVCIKRGGDCNQAFLSHRECVCYDRCPRCSVEFELDVNFDKVNPTRPDQERDLSLTVTSKDLVGCEICLLTNLSLYFSSLNLLMSSVRLFLFLTLTDFQ